ncbi:MAG: hypothetical protein ACOC1F_04130 [Myxococcota bacterium]
MRHIKILSSCLLVTAAALVGCGEDDPEAKSPGGGGSGGGTEEACNPDEVLTVQDNDACSPFAEGQRLGG